MKRILFALVAISGLTINVTAQDPQVKVYVFTAPPAGGFVDEASKHRTETTKEIVSRLQSKKKTITVVTSKDAADVTLEVLSVELADGALQTRANAIGGGARTSAQKEYRVVTKLAVGDYLTPITHQAMFTNLAAGKIADDVD
ncbi:MAG TPA: hypothetical protein VNG73_11180, partial [Gemmatimonadaceae bacterium]|nr:hypothetical protein [Gemmatimonadaceae bacterium]